MATVSAFATLARQTASQLDTPPDVASAQDSVKSQSFTSTETAPPLVAGNGVELHSRESEALLLSIVLQSQRSPQTGKLLGVLGASDFGIKDHETLWQLIGDIYDGGGCPDAPAVIDRARAARISFGGAEYVIGLVASATARLASEKSVDSATKRIKELSIKRRMQASLTKAQDWINKGFELDQVMGFVEDDMADMRRVASSSRTGPVLLGNYATEVVDRLQRVASGEEVAVIGCPSGLGSLNGFINGYAPEDLILLGARPSMGKTAMMISDMLAAGRAGWSPCGFSLEMKGASMARRALSRMGRLSMGTLTKGDLTNDDWSRLGDSYEELMHLGVYMDDTPSLTIQEIRARARKFAEEHDKPIFFIDYLQIVKSANNHRDERSLVQETGRALKELARELKAPVIALCQLSRKLEERANKRPMMSDLRESGTLEQDADVIIFLYRDEYYNPESPERGTIEAIVAKQRDGSVGVAKGAYQGEYMYISDL